MQITDQIIIKTVMKYNAIKARFPLAHFIKELNITPETLLLWIRTKVAVKYFCSEGFFIPADKDKILIQNNPNYALLTILYRAYRINLLEVLRYLEKTVDLSKQVFVELLVHITSARFLNEIEMDAYLTPEIKKLIYELRKGALLTIYVRETYNMTQESEYKLLIHLLWD